VNIASDVVRKLVCESIGPLREETKKASRFDDKKVYLEKKFNIGHSSRRKVDADAVPWAEISGIARFRLEVSDGPALATALRI